jgi:two-component system KDP operon response regulator KdpE
MSGLDLLQHIRELTTAPVIMVTAADQMSTLVEALAAGADDYIVKPYSPKELIARAEAVLRRSGSQSDGDDNQERFADDVILIDLSRNTVVTQAGMSTLTGTERRLLAHLLRNRNRVVTQDELLRSVWGVGYESAAANLHVFVGYLRRKIEPEPRNPRYIVTHRGVGYEFVTE